MNVVLAALFGGLGWAAAVLAGVSVPACAVLAALKIVGVPGARGISWWLLLGEPLAAGFAALVLVFLAYLAASTIRS